MNLFYLIKKINFLIKIINYIIGFFIGVFLFLFIKLIYPFILIRFYNIVSTRLGHMLEDIDIYLSRKKNKLNNSDLKEHRNSIDIFYFRTKICNKYVAHLLKEKLLIFPHCIMYWVDKFDHYTIKYLRFKNIHIIGDSIENDKNHPPLLNRDIHGTYNLDQNFYFNKKEISLGNKILKKMGINSKYVCIYTRDNKYLNETYSYNDWSKHDYRNIDIDILIDTVKLLIEKDFYVVRVGKKAEKKMNFKNDKFIDYSFSNFQNDFMDVFLLGNCDFFISSSSGIDAIATAFRKDIVFPFLFPVMDTKSSTSKHFLAYRNLYSNKLKRNLNFSEIIEKNFGYLDDEKILKKNDLKIVSPSSIEVSKIIEEYLNTKNNYDYNNIYASKFYKIFKSTNFLNNGTIYHHIDNINFKVSQYFLKENDQWLK
jgi:putative glycosyltransferase (TIGR04372 family)